MKYPITLTDTTPYFEKHFMMCEETPHSYVSAFREAQYEALRKRKTAYAVFWVITLSATMAWIVGLIPFLVALIAASFAWALTSWRIRHESKLLARTFELALKGKEREFHEYMWRHLDRRLLRQDF